MVAIALSYDNAAPHIHAVRSAALDKLWEGFNDIADGFGLTQSEFVEVCGNMCYSFRYGFGKRARQECGEVVHLQAMLV